VRLIVPPFFGRMMNKERVLQFVAIVLQRVAVRCSVLQCVAACCSVLQCVAVCCSVLHRVAVCYNVVPCIVVCCSVFVCVAVCFSHAEFVLDGTTSCYLVQGGARLCVWVCGCICA